MEVGITYNRMLCNDFTGPARFRLNMPEVALELKRVWQTLDSKAFDTVNHNILFDIFYHNFGIIGIPLQFFRSYLSKRKQFVKLENVQSSLVDISNGVPQGSVLGPLFFIMYIKMIYLNPLHFMLYYMLMILIFVYLIKILTICSIWWMWN